MSFFTRFAHVLKYSPDQPRDERGRWTEGGGQGLEGARLKKEWIGASPVVVPQHDLVYFGIEYERPWARGGAEHLHR